jgi:hypothetical protein
MQHIMVTPHITHAFLARALKDLPFEEVMIFFGAFFIQKLIASRYSARR